MIYKILDLCQGHYRVLLIISIIDSEGIHNCKCTGCKTCLDYAKMEDNQLIINPQNVIRTIKSILIKT